MFSLWMRCCEHKGLSRSDHMVGNGDDRRARVREQHDSAESLREHEVSGTRALGVGASQGSCGVVGQQGDWVAPSAKLCGLREASAAERLQNSAGILHSETGVPRAPHARAGAQQRRAGAQGGTLSVRSAWATRGLKPRAPYLFRGPNCDASQMR